MLCHGFQKRGLLTVLLVVSQLAATNVNASSKASMSMDSEGRLAITATDVVIHNVSSSSNHSSLQGMVRQLAALETMLQLEMQARASQEQQIAMLENSLQDVRQCCGSTAAPTTTMAISTMTTESPADNASEVKLVASDGAAGDQFGHAVAASDGTMVVGATGDDDKGSSSGSVYVFK